MKQVLAATLSALAISGTSAVSDYVKNNVRTNMGTDRVVHFAHEDMTPEIMDLLESHGADHFGNGDTSSHFKVPEVVAEKLKASDFNFEDATEHWISHFETNFADENFACTDDDCHKRSMQDFYGSYQNLAAIHARARDNAASVDFATIGSIGQSYEGRDQLTVTLSDDGEKPMVFYFCNIHAREWLTPMFCSYMVETLIADGGHPLLDTFTFVILLSANPDGYQYTWDSNSLWRKTRRPNSGSSCVGTDPNRNYDNRHCGAGTSNDPCSEIYCGPQPWSEVEVANIRDFGLANRDRLVAMNDVHAYSELWMTPYGGISQDPPAADFEAQEACNLAAVNAIDDVSGSRWAYGPVYSTIYPAAGVSVDYFYDDVGVVYSMTAELRGTNFQPAASNIMPSNREVFAGMVGSLECVRDREGLGPPTPPTVPSPTPAPVAPTTGCTWFFC